MPTKTLRWLPRFYGDDVITVGDHVEALEKAFRDNEIIHEDIAMKLLANSLDDNAYRWFYGLINNAITRYDYFVKKMRGKWDCKYDDNFLLYQLYDVKKKDNKDIQEFNIRFNKILEKIADNVKPLEKTITLYFMNAFDTNFSFMFKEKKSTRWKL